MTNSWNYLMLMLYPSKWTPVVLEHFNKFVSPSKQYHSGKWVIEEYPGMFDPYSGIANNLSESINAVLKRENDWKELPVDLLALGFYYIQNFENYETRSKTVYIFLKTILYSIWWCKNIFVNLLDKSTMLTGSLPFHSWSLAI